MRRILVLLSIVLLVSTGCQGKFTGYSDKEKEELEAKGRSQLVELLDEEDMLSVEAYVNQPISGKVELTEYVYGQYEEDNSIYDYYLNTKTNEFFISKEFKLLEEEIADSLIQGLKLGDEADVEWMKVAPYLLPND
ncbi:MAG: hypothetical protein HUJ56_13060, partial [Erysipelotrichaceae bacterium]|nr:hypothetical protein [Erysipelotrichaceae bacterium]